jgi:hypothetical protein
MLNAKRKNGLRKVLSRFADSYFIKGELTMAGKNKAVFAIYSTRSGAEHGAEMLLSSGFSSSDISVLFPENLGPKEIGTEKASKAPEGTALGAGSGAIVGGTLGLLASIGALAIPGIGPLIAAGPIVATLAGVGAGGAVGGFTGALIGMGIPEFEAKRYEGRLQRGGILLSVHCETSEDIKRAKSVLEATRAEDVSSTSEASSNVEKADRQVGRAAGSFD